MLLAYCYSIEQIQTFVLFWRDYVYQVFNANCFLSLMLIVFSRFFTGQEGPIAQALYDLILEDMRSGPPSVRIPVPY